MSSQCKNLHNAAPSRICAAIAPSISTEFLQAFFRLQGSLPSTILSCKIFLKYCGVCDGSTNTLPARFSRYVLISLGQIISTSPSRCALRVLETLSGLINQATDASFFKTAKLRAKGVRGTSSPRIFKSHALFSG